MRDNNNHIHSSSCHHICHTPNQVTHFFSSSFSAVSLGFLERRKIQKNYCTTRNTMYWRFGKACLTMAVTGGCCSVVLAASTEESKESVQWAYPSPYDDEDEEDVKRTSCFTLHLI